jgi:hypothetical protein
MRPGTPSGSRRTGARSEKGFRQPSRGEAPVCRSYQPTGVREPVRYVHNDYTSWSGRRRVTDHLEPEHAAERLRGRHAVINVWRPIGGPVEEAPLAVCDARSIAPRDLIPTDLVYPDRVGEVYSMTYNPGVNTAAGARDEGRLGAGAPLPSSSHDPPVRMPLSDDTPFPAAGGGKRVPRAGLVDAVEPVGRRLCEILRSSHDRPDSRVRGGRIDGAPARAPQPRHRPVRGSRRLHGADRGHRPRGGRGPAERDPGGGGTHSRGPRRNGEPVHGRRGEGRVRHPRRARRRPAPRRDGRTRATPLRARARRRAASPPRASAAPAHRGEHGPGRGAAGGTAARASSA